MSSIDLSHVTPTTKIGTVCFAAALLGLLVLGTFWDLVAKEKTPPSTPS